MSVIPIRVDILDTFNSVIDFINSRRNIPRHLHVLDVRFKIIMNYLEDAAKRAIEINDPILIEKFQNMYLISKPKQKESNNEILNSNPNAL